MKSTSQQHYSRLVTSFTRIDSTRRKIETVYSQKKISRRDIELIYEGLFLQSVALFEQWVEDLFIGLLAANVVHRRKSVSPRVQAPTIVAARSVVLSTGRYMDWLPLDRTSRRAKAFFKTGMPFSLLEKKELTIGDTVQTIRNAVAHKSRHSLQTFEQKVIAQTQLPPRSRTPGGFLRHQYTINPPMSHLENLLSDMLHIANKVT